MSVFVVVVNVDRDDVEDVFVTREKDCDTSSNADHMLLMYEEDVVTSTSALTEKEVLL